MKTKLQLIKGTILTTLALSAIGAKAQFSYNSGVGELGDVLVCFRSSSSGLYDLVVDAGSVSTFKSLTRGQSTTISTSLLTYVGTNNVAWSALACQRMSGFPGVNNVWLTRPRTSPGVQTTAWPCKVTYQQASAASQIDTIGNNAVNTGAAVTTPYGTTPANTASAIVEPEGSSSVNAPYFTPYVDLVGSAGNLAGNFWGDSAGISVEQTTPSNFTSSGQPVIADFYELDSANNGNSGTYLGYFKLDTTGVLTYTAGPYIAAPVITSISRTGNTTTIQFQSISGETYNLRGTSTANAATPRSTWPVLGSSQTGNGLVETFTDTTTDASRVYVITGQ